MSLDLFTKLGAPWARYNLKRRPPRPVVLGEMVQCSCGRHFIRTERDPRVVQRCQPCEHLEREAAAVAKEREARPRPVVQFTRRKR